MIGNSSTCENDITVGSRVLCQQSIGTVRYIGVVDGYKDEWLGVDWDEPERGKHDGTVNGVRYFFTRHPRSGSLVRRSKVDRGIDIVEAIQARYVENDIATIDEKLLEECKKVLNSSTFEVVGMQKIAECQGHLTKLTAVGLAAERISYVSNRFETMCPNINELVLTANLISNWQVVADIVKALPNLSFLSLSKNIMAIPDNPAELAPHFVQLKAIVLSYCELTFSQIMQLSLIFPDIENLNVAENLITTLEIPDTERQFRKLEVLNLAGNAIASWDEIMKLGNINTLEQLILNKTKLQSITLPRCRPDEKCEIFKYLKVLHLKDNEINSWRSISELNKLASLESLHFIYNPIMSNINYLEAWSQIVSRISNLQILNRSEIFTEERRGAEYDLLKLHGAEWHQTEGNEQAREEFIEEFNSFPLLITKYGLPETSLTDRKPKCLKSKLLTIKIMNTHDERILVKKLPIKMSIQSLLGLVQKLFDTGSEVPELVYFNAKNPNIEIPLNNVTKSLDYFSLQNDDIILAKW